MFSVRDPAASDVGYILDSWLATANSSPSFRGISRDDFYAEYRRRFKSALADERVRVLVVCSERDPDAIIGWAAMVGTTVLWAYCRSAFRGEGIIKSLVENCDGYMLASRNGAPGGWTYRPWVWADICGEK